MAEISRFLGIVITMRYRERVSPHFHAMYADFHASIDVETGVVCGLFPRRALMLIQEWRILHLRDLRDAWLLARAEKTLPNIAPLE